MGDASERRQWWREYPDEVPGHGQVCIVLVQGEHWPDFDMYDEHRRGWVADDYDFRVTHWMPIPKWPVGYVCTCEKCRSESRAVNK